VTPNEQDVGTILSTASFVLGFLTRSLVQWYLQKSKAREEMLRAFSTDRAHSLKSLWSKTMVFQRLDHITINDDWRKEQDEVFTTWYFTESGALFLSWQATKLYFRAVRTLREGGSKESMKKSYSDLRTRLKRDVGIYNWWESLRYLGNAGNPLGSSRLPPRPDGPARLERTHPPE
jgi:hypothetical protein